MGKQDSVDIDARRGQAAAVAKRPAPADWGGRSMDKMLLQDASPALAEFQAAYVALRRADRAGQHPDEFALPFVPVLDRGDFPRGTDVRLSRLATPAVSLHLARMRAAWELLPERLRSKAHVVIAIERAAT